MTGPTLLLLAASAAHAGVTRFAVLVGTNEGAAESRPLYFAEDDARKVQDILTTVGDVPKEGTDVLLGAHRNDVLHALARVRQPIALAEARGEDTVLVFYYAGHADEQGLQLGRTSLTWQELDQLLVLTGADVRLAFLDACRSGSMTRTRGGKRAPSFVFDLSERLDATGQVVITSSTGDESSQESDEIGGGYFTHFLASALAGAGDEDRDGKVTLGEAYRFVYRETVYKTSGSHNGTQHPTYEWNLAGKGDVVLADLDSARATLVFSPSFTGRYAIFDRNRRAFVAELELDGTEQRSLSLKPGSYLVQERFPTHLLVAEVNLAEGQTVGLDGATFAAVEYERDVARGAIQKKVRRAGLPHLSLNVSAGSRTFSDKEFAAAYFPTMIAAGAQGRWNWIDGKWLAADVVSGTGAGNLSVSGLPYSVPVVVTGTTFGVSAGWATRPRAFQGGLGVRMAAAWLGRSFPNQGLPSQEMFTIAPGFVLWGGWHPGKLELELALRTHYLPYIVDDRDQGVSFSEALLCVGYRF